MKRLMLGVLMACSVAALTVDAQRRVKFDGKNEYTLTVEKQTGEQISAWWIPFQQQNSLEGYCWNLNTLPLASRPQLADKAKILEVGGAGQLTQVIEIPPGKKTVWHGVRVGRRGAVLRAERSRPDRVSRCRRRLAVEQVHPNVHISELVGPQAYAHKHGNQPIFVILKGSGYDIWSEARDLEQYEAAVKVKTAHRADYGTGTLCGVPGGPHWHQHFSTGTEPLRYLAIVPRGEYEDKTPGTKP